AIERLMWGRNAPTGMDVARASGVIVLAAAQAGVAVEEYAPLEIKMAVTGVGNAGKDAVRRGLGRELGMVGVPSDPDAADAAAEERIVFDHLVTVSGVGPKMALAVLSTLSPDALRRAVATGDTAALTLVPGIGKKVAGRIVLDLKDRLGTGEASTTGPLAEV